MAGKSYTLYGLKNCDTCRKALKEMETAGLDVDFIDIRADADLPKLVPQWLSRVDAAQLVNKRSTTWRALNEAEQHAALSDGTADSLIANPTLIKRPVIVIGEDVSVGWTAKTLQNLSSL